MLKVIVVEDDKLALEILCEFIEEKFPMLSVCASFSNPLKSLEYLDENTVDIIITDVKMPQISGVELAEYATEKYPFVKIILISAFQDFEIACKALNTNVISYILKPITFEKLNDALKPIIDSSNQKKQLFSSEILTLRRENFVKDLIDEKLSSPELIEKKLGELGIPINTKSVQCLIVSAVINDFEDYLNNVWKHKKENLYSAITNIINDSNTETNFGISYEHTNENIMQMFFVDRDKREDFDESLITLKKLLNSILKIDVDFEIVTSFSSIFMITKNYEDNTPENKLLDKLFRPQKIYNLTAGDLKKIEGNENELRAFSEKLAKRALNYINPIFIEQKNYNLYAYVNCVSKECLLDYILKTAELVSEFKKKESQLDLLNKAIKYIEENYMNPITLDEISSHVAFAPWSFCKFFKKYTGKSFTNYLNDYRIKAALDILKREPDVKINFLSFKVGFPTNSNFYKNFKLYTGMTPSEYQKKIRENGYEA